MDLSSHELRTVELREAFRGYRQDDVDALLDRVADVLEERERDLRRLRERLVRSEEAAAGAPGEQQLSRALMAAQRAADQLVAEAEEEAATTRRAAVDEARRLRDESRAEAESVRASAQTEATELDAMSRRDADRRVTEATARAEALVADAEESSATTLADAETRSAAMLADAETRSATTLADAEAHRSQLVADAEERAAGIVADARLEAARVAEERRRELAIEVDRLTARRRDLAADVDQLDRFVAEHRPRVRALLESELARFDGGARLGLPELPTLVTSADDPMGGPTVAEAIVAVDRAVEHAPTPAVAPTPSLAKPEREPEPVAADEPDAQPAPDAGPVAEPVREVAVLEVLVEDPGVAAADGAPIEPARPDLELGGAAAEARPVPAMPATGALTADTVRLLPLATPVARPDATNDDDVAAPAARTDAVGDREPGTPPARPSTGPAVRRADEPALRLVGTHDEPVTAEVVIDDFDDELDLEASPRVDARPVSGVLPFDDGGPPTMAWGADDDEDDEEDEDDDEFDDVVGFRSVDRGRPTRPQPEPVAERARAARIEIDLDAVRPRPAGPPPEVVVIDLDAVAARPTPVREAAAPARTRRRPDDDPYLASLRAAVEDDSPLGPRAADEPLYDDDDVDDIPGRFGIFRRRR
jgi:DivIVA domain-containing protein